MIEDPELRALFRAESEEHLQTLENGLLHLEAEPCDGQVLEELFRSAHSLKGAARMLGVVDVETLAHCFEDELGAARRGHVAMSSAAADRLYRGLDAMRRLAEEAGGGESANVDMADTLRCLHKAESTELTESPADVVGKVSARPASDRAKTDDPIATYMKHAPRILAPPGDVLNGAAWPVPEIELNSAVPFPRVDHFQATSVETMEAVDDSNSPLSANTFKIETIRVEAQKLDALMTLAGEMAVTTTRVARAMSAISDLSELWEEWDRDITALPPLLSGVSGGSIGDTVPGTHKRLINFLDREPERLERLGRLLGQIQGKSDEGITRLGLAADELDAEIRGMRLLPFSTIFNLFPRMVRDLSREQQKEVQLILSGGTITADKHLLEEMKDPLMHLIRNAIDHGVETPDERLRQGKPRTATLRLSAWQSAVNVVIEVSDDGRGLDADLIRSAAMHKHVRTASEISALSSDDVHRLIFEPGFSTNALITDVSGRGIGLDVVRTNIEHIKGSLSVESIPGSGCKFRMEAPLKQATARVLLVQVVNRSYAIPVEAVLETAFVSPQSVFAIEGRPSIRRDNQHVPMAHLRDLLELPSPDANEKNGKVAHRSGPLASSMQPYVLLAEGKMRVGLFVDALLDVQEVVLKPFGGLLQRVRNVTAATVLSTGEICMVLNPRDLIKSAQEVRIAKNEVVDVKVTAHRKLLLLAEDSITTRTQEKRILESAGYEVQTAVDGVDALSKLSTRIFDAVVTDIEMPNMDGLTLAGQIRQNAKYKDLPIILVTSLASDEDRRRGIEVGANAYIIKGTFEQTVLLDTLRRLV